MMKNINFDQQILKTKQKNRLIYKYKVVGIDPSIIFNRKYHLEIQTIIVIY